MDAPAAVLAMVTTVTDHLGGTAAPTSWRRRSILHRSSPLSPLPASIIPLLFTVDTTRPLTATATTARPATAGADAGRLLPPATGTVAVCGDGGINCAACCIGASTAARRRAYAYRAGHGRKTPALRQILASIGRAAATRTASATLGHAFLAQPMSALGCCPESQPSGQRARMQTKTTEWGCKKKLGYPLVRRRPGSHARMAAMP